MPSPPAAEFVPADPAAHRAWLLRSSCGGWTAQRPQEVAVRPAAAVTAGAELLDRMELGQAENSWWGSDTFLLRRWRILFLKILNSDIVRLQKKLRDVA